jgi:hypothetical protein
MRQAAAGPMPGRMGLGMGLRGNWFDPNMAGVAPRCRTCWSPSRWRVSMTFLKQVWIKPQRRVWDSAQKARISMLPGRPTPGRHRSGATTPCLGWLVSLNREYPPPRRRGRDGDGPWQIAGGIGAVECMVAVGKSFSLCMCSVEKAANFCQHPDLFAPRGEVGPGDSLPIVSHCGTVPRWLHRPPPCLMTRTSSG